MPRPNAIPPTVTKETTGPMAGIRKNHPAYGLLRFSRVQGGCGKLFGSEINHNSFIQMELTDAEEVRSGSHTYHFGHVTPLASVRMSAAQFSELITTLNMGSGTPVTIDYLPDSMGQRPYIEDTDTLHEQIKAEVKQKGNDAFVKAESLAARLRETVLASKLSKTAQTELINMVESLTNTVKAGLPHVIDMYQEAAEKVGAKAKAELEAYAMGIKQQLGEQALARLNEKAPTLVIEASSS